MTAKMAISRRCADCEGRRCEFTDCALYGLRGAQVGADRVNAIRAYCRWCMCGAKAYLCSCTQCPIYQYRAQPGVALHVNFKPEKPPTGTNAGASKRKNVEVYHPAFGGANSVPYAGGTL